MRAAGPAAGSAYLSISWLNARLVVLLVLLVSLQLLLFFRTELGLLLLFSFAFILFPCISHVYFSSGLLHPTLNMQLSSVPEFPEKYIPDSFLRQPCHENPRDLMSAI